MAGRLASFTAKQLLAKKMDRYKNNKVTDKNDPYFYREELPNGKSRKLRKQIPNYIPEHDAKVLERCKEIAYRLDIGLFSIGKLQFGWSSVIGLVPELGDLLDFIIAIMLVSRCRKVDRRLGLLLTLTMLGNCIADFFIGLVPLIGDICDAQFKANTRNVAILEKHLMVEYAKKAGIVFKDFEELDKARYEDMHNGSKPKHDEKTGGGADLRRKEEPVRKSHEGKWGRRWYGGHDRSYHHDLEMGTKSSTRAVGQI